MKNSVLGLPLAVFIIIFLPLPSIFPKHPSVPTDNITMGKGDLVPRILTRFDVSCRTADQTRFVPAQSVNLSITGICLRLQSALEPQQHVTLRIALSEAYPPFDVAAKVVWVRKRAADNAVYVGLGFLNLSEQHRDLIQQFEQENAAQLLRFISEFPLFQHFSADDCTALVKIMTRRDLNKKEILYQQDQRDHDLQGLFIVQTGLLNIYKGPNLNPNRQIAVVSTGEIFGETTLVTDQPHSATIAAVNPSTVLQINKIGFRIIRDKNAPLAVKILEIVARSLSARLSRTTNMLFTPLAPQLQT